MVLHGVTGPDGNRTEQNNSSAGQSAAGAVTRCYRVLHGVTGPDGDRTEQHDSHAGQSAAGARGAAEEGRGAKAAAAVVLLRLHLPQGRARETAPSENRSQRTILDG